MIRPMSTSIQRGKVRSWGRCSALGQSKYENSMAWQKQLTAWITDVVGRRQNMSLGPPSIEESVVAQG
jgi:hypothetical protein